MSEPVSHPLALAARRAHPWDDAIRAAQAQGEAIDTRIAALAVLSEPTDAARTEIRAALAELGRAVAAQAGGEVPPLWSWYRSALGEIARHARRLFRGESWVQDIRPPAWTPT